MWLTVCKFLSAHIGRCLTLFLIAFATLASGSAIAADAPIIYVVGDPSLVAAGLNGLSLIVGAKGGAMYTALRIGLLIALVMACVAWFSKGKMSLIGVAGGLFVGWAFFFQTTPVIVQTYFSYSGSIVAGTSGGGIGAVGGAAAFKLVDKVPLGFAIPMAVSGAISTSLAEAFMTAYSTLPSVTSAMNSDYETGTLQFVDPLRQLMALRSINPCLSSQICKSVFEYTRYCLVGTVTGPVDPNTNTSTSATYTVDMQALARSPVALDDLLLGINGNGTTSTTPMPGANWVNGMTRYYPLANSNGAVASAGQDISCSEAGQLIRNDISTFMSGNTMRTAAGVLTNTPGSREVIGAVTQSNNSTHPAVGALQYVTAANAAQAAGFVEQLAFWPAVEAGLVTANQPMDSAQFTALSIVNEGLEKWRVDGTAEGSMFLRTLFSGMNVLLFVLICMTPIVFLLAVTMLGEGMKLLKEYVIALLWTQSWFPTAVVVNFYITEMLSSKLGSFNATDKMAIMSPVGMGNFYQEVGNALASAGWMMGAIPIISYALIRGSTQGMVSLATKAAGGGGGANYADESRAAPGLETAVNTKAMNKGAQDSGLGAAYASGGGSTSPGTMHGGSGMSVGSSAGTGVTAQVASSAAKKAEEASTVADAAVSKASATAGDAIKSGAGIQIKTGSGATFSMGEGSNFTNSEGNAQKLSGQAASLTAFALKAGLNAGQMATASVAAVAGAAAMDKAIAGKATPAAVQAAGSGAMKAALTKGGATAAVGALAAMMMGAASGLSAGAEGKTQETKTLANEVSSAASWVQSQAKSKGSSIDSGSSFSVGNDASKSNALNTDFSNAITATDAATRANTNATTASTTAANSSGVNSGASLNVGDVATAAAQYNLPSGAVGNAVQTRAAQLVASGSITPEQGAAALAAFNGSMASQKATNPALANNATGQQQMAFGAAALMTQASGSPATQMIGGMAFGDAAGAITQVPQIAQQGNVIAQAFGGAVPGALTAASGAASALAGNPGGVPAMPGAPTSAPGNAGVRSAVTTGAAGIRDTVDSQSGATNAGVAAGQAAHNAAINGANPSGVGPPIPDSNLALPTRNIGGGVMPLINPKSVGEAAPDQQLPPQSLAPSGFNAVTGSDDWRATKSTFQDDLLARIGAGEITPAQAGVLLEAAFPASANLVNKERAAALTAQADTTSHGRSPLRAFGEDNAETILGTAASFHPVFGAGVALVAAPLKWAGGRLFGAGAGLTKASSTTGSGAASAATAIELRASQGTNFATKTGAPIAPSTITVAAPSTGGAAVTLNADAVAFAQRSLAPVPLTAGTSARWSASAPTSPYAVPSATSTGYGATLSGRFVPAPAVQSVQAVSPGTPVTTALKGAMLGLAVTGAAVVNDQLTSAPTLAAPSAAASVPGTAPPPAASGPAARRIKPVTPPPKEYVPFIQTAAARTGLSVQSLVGLLQAESGGNWNPAAPNAGGSRALGLAQFMPDTWLALATDGRSSLYRESQQRGMVSTVGGRPSVTDGKRDELLGLRRDPRMSIDAAADLAHNNLKALAKANLEGIGDPFRLAPEKTAGYAYMLHLAGAPDGIDVLRNGTITSGPGRGMELLRAQLTGDNNRKRDFYLAQAGGDPGRAFGLFAADHARRHVMSQWASR